MPRRSAARAISPSVVSPGIPSVEPLNPKAASDTAMPTARSTDLKATLDDGADWSVLGEEQSRLYEPGEAAVFGPGGLLLFVPVDPAGPILGHVEVANQGLVAA